ncbi:MAG TPA: WecB/TagA/CpsF family glycosyltransferase [Oxalicibacterium sp.]|uniref:WecB/TagA/CpsF family glycosyltransferase n=1 Tax=Oxalicibacterium sp. TaxID=2766525 RepID=UPI002CE4AC4C|nr:WecB/TagA/CpsF family glycosyltransferase [Oxalicibacterium sp.]HWU97499.1 WecB/TagA/CpsF family glycosyltransferase [Oxalicibacterium sp.]
MQTDIEKQVTYPIHTDFRRRVVCILGLPFDVVTLDQAVEKVATAAEKKSRCFLSTPNLNFAVASMEGGAFRDSVIRSDLSVADGMPLVWIARLLGLPIRERVAGSTLFEILRDGSARKTNAGLLSVYFFGGPDGVAERAAEKLNASSSWLRCAGSYSPGFESVENMSSADVIDRINSSGADFVVVALGAKKGQAWIERNLSRLRAPVISHLGAVVNFVAGTVSRAPVWVRQLGCEWLWRIKEEPALWRRYWNDGLMLLRLAVTRVLPCAVATRMKGRDLDAMARARVSVRMHERRSRIVASGAWGEGNLSALRDACERITATPCNVHVDFARVTQIDSACIGLLLLLYGHQTKIGRDFEMHNVRPSVMRTMRLHCADYLVARPDRVQGFPQEAVVN